MNKIKRETPLMKQQLSAGKPQIGIFSKAHSLELVEIIGLAGFDFIVIDMEHTALTFQQVEQMVRAADLYGLHTIVRVPDAQASTILHALDLGATGIQVPQINDARDVKAVIKSAMYPPRGIRGVTYAHRAAKYGFVSGKQYMQEANERTTIAVHIETVSAYQQVDEICGADGLDVVFIGPVDLSIALQVSPDYLEGGLSEAVKTILESCRKNGKQPGIVVNNEREYRFALEQGIPYIVWGSDLAVFKQALTSIKQLQEQIDREI
ncbi:aldolase/citrate lyase family protein [Brevibacillus ruminantium]|uniref:Aldolase/citrate lyase family protein n=1 Tax=Brevibacillus ruminantium TaxID=2950604 RepID=A0ABY4WBY6_9BACL|nr:aldolase/citrate lyase family protein [Brevibacillus ruminantium]USG64693.1 aldolase/citrate lyase family protein [Brevibacillus ruminantium]